HRPLRQMSYQPLGDLHLHFPGHEQPTDYHRELDLESAIARVAYTAGGVRFRREIFASAVDQAIVLRLTADRPGQLSFSITMSSPQAATVTIQPPATLVLRGTSGEAQGIPGSVRFEGRGQIRTEGGAVAAGEGRLDVTRADAVTILIVAATSYKR